MCQLKSGIILKDRIYIDEGDSHTDMLKELGIEDSRKNAESLFVRAELIPPNGDVFTDAETWKFNVDQDIRPEWFVEPYEKERMVKAVKEWADKHVLIGRKNERISNGTYYLKDCINIIYGNSTVKACDNSTVKACDNSTVEAYGNSTVKACGNSTVKACDNSTAIIPNWSSNNRDNIILMQNSTLKDCKTKTIYQSGDWQFIKVEETNEKTK